MTDYKKIAHDLAKQVINARDQAQMNGSVHNPYLEKGYKIAIQFKEDEFKKNRRASRIETLPKFMRKFLQK